MTAAAPILHIDPATILSEHDRTRKAAYLQCLAQHARITVFDILHEKGTGHWGGAASAAELLTTLYFDIMNVRPGEPDWEDRDRLIVSKGHASCMLYTLLAERGYFPPEELRTFRDLDSRMQGHPCMNKTPGVEMSTGALGHGVSVGLGMALAARVLKKDYWTFVLAGDGCLNEGETWEGIMGAAKFKPERFALLIDYNKVQLDGPSNEIMPMDPLPDKFRAFSWNVAPELFDGHSVESIFDSWQWMQEQKEWPLVVIYNTHKGHGISFTADQSKWHGAPIDDDAYAKGRPELMATLEALKGALPS